MGKVSRLSEKLRKFSPLNVLLYTVYPYYKLFTTYLMYGHRKGNDIAT